MFLLAFLVLYAWGDTVAPGVTHQQRQFYWDGDGPFTMHVLEVDPAEASLKPVKALDRPQRRETLSSMAQRYGAVAAINGGYFVASGPDEGKPAGLYVLEGRVIGEGQGRTVLAFCRAKSPGIHLEIAVEPVCEAKDIVGAGPRLVRRGMALVPDEGFAHQNVRHPRTAVALTNRGTILLVTVDGRQASSVGMRLDELAAELVTLGAMEAINMDGGGSTEMIVSGRIVNSPSDGKERPLGDGILILPPAPPD